MIRNRPKRHIRIRKKIAGTEQRPRLSVFRSLKGIYVQLIDDDKSITLLGLGNKEIEKTNKGKKMTKKDVSFELGKEIAKRAIEKNIKTVVFDRGGNKYHGRVAELARGAREAGLEF